MSLLRMLPLVNWNNGIIMIVVFVAVCIALVTALLLLMNSGKDKKST